MFSLKSIKSVSVLIILIITVNYAQNNKIGLISGDSIFVNGINVAWNNYGTDVGDQQIDKEWFKTMLDSMQGYGGNAIRWWLFTNCSSAPVFDENTGLVKGPGPATINNIKTVLDMAHKRGIVVSLCLLSFDMMQTSQQGVNEEFNKKMLQTDEGIESFIDNALIPIVQEIGKHPAIMCWEMFNEPEGMCSDVDWADWADASVSITEVQTMINRAAGAIHRNLPGVPVSNGSWCFKVSSETKTRDEEGFNLNYYSDSALIQAGGDEDGTLDFYQVHYYPWAKEEFSPFHHDVSYWGLDKPVVIGEFSAEGLSIEMEDGTTQDLTPEECYSRLYENGYAGAMSWTYTDHDGHGGLEEASEGISYLHENYPEDIEITLKPVPADDQYFIEKGSSLNISAPGVLGNDTDYTGNSLSMNGVVQDVEYGELSLSSDGSFSYTPESGFRGLDIFTYSLDDNLGGSVKGVSKLYVYDPEIDNTRLNPVPSDWTALADWWDPVIDTIDRGIIVNNRAFGPPVIWAVNSGKSQNIEAGKEYHVDFEYKDDAANPAEELRFQLLNTWEDRGPDSVISEVVIDLSETSAYEFSWCSAEFSSEYSGDFNLAFRTSWDDADSAGPDAEFNSYIRNIIISPADNPFDMTTGTVDIPETGKLSSLNSGVSKPLLIQRDRSLLIKTPENNPTFLNNRFTLMDVKGRRVKSGNFDMVSGEGVIPLKRELNSGIYILRYNTGAEEFYAKVIKE